MLVIRLQRTGRSGHAHFRIAVQDKRFSASNGRVVAYLGSYDPHTKTISLDSDKTSKYLNNGAQPSNTVASLLRKEGIKLPSWVKIKQSKERAPRYPDKRRTTNKDQPPATEQPVEPAGEDIKADLESAPAGEPLSPPSPAA